MKNLLCLLLILLFGCNRNQTIDLYEFGADPIVENIIVKYQVLAYVAEQKSLTAIYNPQDVCIDNLVSLKYNLCADTINYTIEKISYASLISDVKDRPNYIRKLNNLFVACYNQDYPDSGMSKDEIIASFKGSIPIANSIIFEGDYWILNYVKDNVLIKTIHSEITDKYQKYIYPI